MSLVRAYRRVDRSDYTHTTPISMGASATSKSRSVSALVHGSVPGVSIIAAPAAIPKRTDSLSGQPLLNPTVIADTIASPAPTPLTPRTGIAEKRLLSVEVASTAPSDPSDTTTASARPQSTIS